MFDDAVVVVTLVNLCQRVRLLPLSLLSKTLLKWELMRGDRLVKRAAKNALSVHVAVKYQPEQVIK